MALKTVKWIGFAKFAGLSRTETYDVDYGKNTPLTGNKPMGSTKKLGFVKNGVVLINNAAFTELMTPKWGEDKNQIFVDTLPYVGPAVPQYLTISNWKKFPVNKPTTENDPTILYRIRKVRVGSSYIEFQHAPYSEFWWNLVGVEEWLLVGDPTTKQIPNPDYVDYSAAISEYLQKLHETFILMGDYVFPGMPCQGSWKWYMGDTPTTTVEISQDCNFPLAVTTPRGGWKMIFKPMPTSDQEHNDYWNSVVRFTAQLQPPTYTAEYKTRKILNWDEN
jgi:hypothetical protein